jgi:hypothetical protein
MGYDWNKAADENAQSERVPAGRHRLKVGKIIFGKKDGTKFSSQAGDPQILLVFSDNQDRETSQMFTLSDAAGWTMARLLKAAGANVERMTKDGVTPQRFADETFANAQLLGRDFEADVVYEKGKDGKDYARVTPLRSKSTETVPSQQEAQEIPI